MDANLDAARRQLYRHPPEEFLAARRELAAALDDAALAEAVTALRKPTLAAWIVNAYVAENRAAVDQLSELHGRLQQAHADADAGTLRELSRQRRELVGTLARDAVQASGRAASPSVQDDVVASFDAAVADPDVAARLGSLQRGERWSGFGVSVVGTPELTLVQSDDTAPAESASAAAPPDDRVDAAQTELAAAENRLADAQSAEDELAHRIRRLTTRLTTLQHDLEQARRDLAEAKSVTARAKRDRRSARSVLDRVERRAR